MARVHSALGVVLLLSAGFLVHTTLAPSGVHAYCRSSTETEPSGLCELKPGAILLNWQRSCIELSFHERIFERLELSEAEVRQSVQASFDTWMDVACGGEPFLLSMAQDTTTAEPVEFVFDAPNTSVLSAQTPEEWRELDQPRSAFAITFLWHNKNTGEIYDVDLALNLYHQPFTDCIDGCRPGDVDLQNTVTHELGHVLGLGHSDVKGSTMQDDAGAGETFMRDLEPDDEAGVCALQLPGHECTGTVQQGCTCPAPPIVPSVVRTRSGCAVAEQGGPRVDLSVWTIAGILVLWVGRTRRAR
ncbi:MAG: matrixin family metalloprotease [Myxococcales bacterium]|nr:matrixin family metalloprotease [Myxococcales bacterium]MDD9965342.1 matrixin family metalloprotease [Myxococcales bacterium]